MLAVGLVGWMLRRADMRVRGWVVIVAAVLFVPIGYILPATVVFPVALTELILLLTATRRWESSVTITTNDPQVGLPATCCSLGFFHMARPILSGPVARQEVANQQCSVGCPALVCRDRDEI
jgi:hypothetical protein